jgi:hypothetical protein
MLRLFLSREHVLAHAPCLCSVLCLGWLAPCDKCCTPPIPHPLLSLWTGHGCLHGLLHGNSSPLPRDRVPSLVRIDVGDASSPRPLCSLLSAQTG